jgi:hypothetical protein
MGKLALLLILSLSVPVNAGLQDQGVADQAEYDIKAAFLFNFARFTEWPDQAFAGPTAPLVLGIYGVDPFNRSTLDEISSRSISGRRVEVRKMDDPKTLGDCHIIFVNGIDDKNLATLMSSIKNKPVLTVGESEKFGPSGGMIRFYIEDTKVRFEVHLPQVQRANLKISAKLLSLARVVR